jgi:hypothetical protein
MEWKCAVVVTFLLITVMSMAGCTGSPPAPVATPAPVSVTVTVPGTPAPAGTTVTVSPATARTTLPAAVPDHPYSKMYTFEATGDYVHTFTTTNDGTWVFRMTYPGKEDFVVRLQDNHYDNIDVLANAWGSYTGTKSMWLKAGTYYLDVSAGSPWTITMSTA